MPSPDEVRRWNLGELTSWTGKLVESRATLMSEFDATKRHFENLGQSWQGLAYNAAYDRVGQDHTQGQKLAYEIDALIDVLNSGISSVSGFRDTLLVKLNDATAVPLEVDASWKVLEKDGVDAEVVRTHQDAITAAYNPFRDAVEALAKAIGDQALEIRSGGDLLGSSLDVADADNQAARFGKQDGKALADAARTGDTAAIDEIASNMPEHVLSAEELRRLANGEDVSTVPAAVQDYYKALYQEAGKDGVLERIPARIQRGRPRQGRRGQPTVPRVGHSQQRGQLRAAHRQGLQHRPGDPGRSVLRGHRPVLQPEGIRPGQVHLDDLPARVGR